MRRICASHSPRGWLIALTVAVAAALGHAPRAHAVATATLDLQDTPTIVGNSAFIDVQLMFASTNPADRVQAIELSLFDSDGTAGNTDFSRFDFNLALSGWSEEQSIAGGGPPGPGIGTYISDLGMPSTALAPDDVTPYLVGTLEFDFSGLPGSTSFTIRLNGGIVPDSATNIAGTVDGVLGVSFNLTPTDDNALLLFADPDGVVVRTPEGGPIPEPTTAALMLGALTVATSRFSRRRRS